MQYEEALRGWGLELLQITDKRLRLSPDTVEVFVEVNDEEWYGHDCSCRSVIVISACTRGGEYHTHITPYRSMAEVMAAVLTWAGGAIEL